MDFDTADFMELVNLEDFDFGNVTGLDPMGFPGMSQ